MVLPYRGGYLSPEQRRLIERRPLRPGELTPGDPHRQAPDPFGYQPSQQASWTDTAAVLPRDPPQQSAQSVADVFGSPQSGATSMAETPHQKAARIAREAFARDPSLIKEFMPKLQAVGVDPAMGAPKGWALPDTGSLTAEDMAAPFMSRPIRQSAPPSPLAPELIAPGAGGSPFNRSGFSPTSPFADPAMNARLDQTRSLESVSPSPGFPRYDPLTSPRAPSMPPPSVAASANQSPPSPAVGSIAGGFMRSPALPQARPPIENLPVADIFSGGGAGPPPPGLPRPRPMDSLIAGRPDAPLGGMPAPPQFAGNMPRPRPEQQFAGNMPQPRPDMPQDVAALSPDQRIADASRAAAQEAVRQQFARQPETAPLRPPLNLAGAGPPPPLGSTGALPPALDMAGQSVPAGTRLTEMFGPQPPKQAQAPLIRPDLIAGPPTPPSLPASVMESIRASYNPTASGGPAVPQTPEEERARQALIAKLRGEEELIASPPASVPPIEPVTLGASAPETAGMATPAPLIAPPATTPTNPRLSPKEIEKRARTRGFGTVENLTGDRIARGVGAGLGAAAGIAAGGGLPLAASLGSAGYRFGDDMRRGWMNRNIPGAGILGGIFGMGRKKRDRDKEERANGTPPSREPASGRESSRSSGGLGSDRYSGGTYGGYGGRYINEGTGGAYRNR